MASIFSGPPSPPPAQFPSPPPAPPVMPQPDPEAQKREEIKKLAQARSRTTTRAATILGNDDDTLG